MVVHTEYISLHEKWWQAALSVTCSQSGSKSLLFAFESKNVISESTAYICSLLGDCHVHNLVACPKPLSLQVSYVLDTEDYFHRAKVATSSTKGFDTARRTFQFQKWLMEARTRQTALTPALYAHEPTQMSVAT